MGNCSQCEDVGNRSLSLMMDLFFRSHYPCVVKSKGRIVNSENWIIQQKISVLHGNSSLSTVVWKNFTMKLQMIKYSVLHLQTILQNEQHTQ